jgi:hypothetical protein
MKLDQKVARPPEVNPLNITIMRKQKENRAADQFFSILLEDAIRVAKAIEDKNGGNPMRAEMLARAVGFNQPGDWRFQDLLKAARMYGLTSGAGPKAHNWS